MVCDPVAEYVAGVQVACADPLSVWAEQPVIVVPPSLNVTFPVGVPPPGLVTVTDAVYVTDWPTTDGFDAFVTAVAVSALFTVWVKLPDVEVLKLLSPL